MSDVLDRVRDHYGAASLMDRLKAALSIFGPPDTPLLPIQLAALDEFHTRGLPATAELADLAAIAEGSYVLDVGCGIGGPARFLAATRGCRVLGVDLSAPFVEAARYLSERTGQGAQVSFEVGSALALPTPDASFDVVMLQHVAMNIAERARLYREVRRVLRAGGRFATFDIIATGGQPHYPVPWARTPDTSFLLSAEETRDAVLAAGFRITAWRDDTEVAKAWFSELLASGPPPPPNLGVIMGPEMPVLAANLGRNLTEGRLGVLTAVFEVA